MFAKPFPLLLAALLSWAPAARAALVMSADTGSVPAAGSFSAQVLSGTDRESVPEPLFNVLKKSPFSSHLAPFTPRNQVQASLWLFVGAGQALRDGDAFQLLQSNLVTVGGRSTTLLSAVPLPDAGWQFGIGLMGVGLALSRASRRERIPPTGAAPVGA